MIASGPAGAALTRPAEVGIVFRLLSRLVPVLLALASAACPDFQPDPPAGPTPLTGGQRFATITVEYRQPQHCANTSDHCLDRVVFFGSWMAKGDEVLLDTPAGPYFWTGVVHDVPVNWPPSDQPHYVRVFDPHLKDTPTTGLTAGRLVVGSQSVSFYDQAGTPLEAGLIYVDDNGIGHNPY
jgi:hypothetical protein